MATKPVKVKVPESKGKFRRDVYERAMKAVRHFSSGASPYRAVGENRSSHRRWDSEKTKTLKALARTNTN